MVTFCLKNGPYYQNQGKLHSGAKSGILGYLSGFPDSGPSPSAKETSVIVLVMAAVIHIIKSQRATVFGEYTQKDLMPYLQSGTSM